MADQTRVNELLDHWEEARENRQELTAEELCRDCPELLDKVRRQIEALRTIDGQLNARLRDESAEPSAGHDRPSIPNFDVEAELGRGGMGIVYRARQHATGRLVALKMILCNQDASFQELARFRIEAEAMACLDDPNILKILDVGCFAGYPFVVLELAERGNLKELAAGQPQPARWCAELVKTLALALQHAHGRGMLHRDLKPVNVLMMGDGTPKISDFGLVKFSAPIAKVHGACMAPGLDMSEIDMELDRMASEFNSQYRNTLPGARDDDVIRSTLTQCVKRTELFEAEAKTTMVREFVATTIQQRRRRVGQDFAHLRNLTQAGSTMGTPMYMVPEQASGDHRNIGRHTDIYALGGILYELLTGQAAFRPSSQKNLYTQIWETVPTPLRKINPNIPTELEAICLKCLSKEISGRYPNATALVEDLDEYLRQDGTHLHESSPPRSSSFPEKDALKTISKRPGGGKDDIKVWNWWPFRGRAK